MRRVSLNYYYLTEINILNTVAVVQSLSCVWLCDLMDCSTPGSSVLHYSLSMSTESVMLSNCLILCHSLSFCLQSFRASVSFPMSRLFRWPKDWSFSVSPSSEYSGLFSFRTDWFDLLVTTFNYFWPSVPVLRSLWCIPDSTLGLHRPGSAGQGEVEHSGSDADRGGVDPSLCHQLWPQGQLTIPLCLSLLISY